MSIESCDSSPFLVVRLSPTGQGDHVGALAPVLVPGRTGNFVAVDVRHSDIEDDDIGTALPAQFQCLISRMGDDDLMAAKLQQHAHGVGRIAVVVGYEDPDMHSSDNITADGKAIVNSDPNPFPWARGSDGGRDKLLRKACRNGSKTQKSEADG